MKNTSVACNIVILPSADLAQKSIATSQQLAQANDTLFTLKDGEYYPHATLYMVQLYQTDLEKAQTILSDIASHTGPLTLQADHYFQAVGYIDANYIRTPEVDALHWAIVKAINPIRAGMRQKNKQRMLEATGLARENFEKYGDHRVGDLFRPHITLTRFTDGQPIDDGALPPASVFDGVFTRIGLFEMGDNGTCVRKIAVFPLVG